MMKTTVKISKISGVFKIAVQFSRKCVESIPLLNVCMCEQAFTVKVS